ncbi:MAG: hypothetical protein OXJ64_19105, partial [Boseongicola sp.]|nr:hypothetical protein [Boseongicola sp.]
DHLRSGEHLMKLASIRNGPDGRLIAVSKGLSKDAFGPVGTLHALLDDGDAKQRRLKPFWQP